MTALRQDAMNLLEQVPEDKLYFIVQIMQGLNGLYGESVPSIKDKAFETLESLRRKAPEIDYSKELESYREEKYGTKGIN